MRQKPIIVNDAVVTECFSSTYPFINNYLVNEGEFVYSRNGNTREIIDFKTTVTNPYKRLVGGNKREVNVFFLMAEALWIWLGRRDVKFLNLFNSRMKDYSDDGITFNAPYGWRMRNFGVDSTAVKDSSNMHYFDGQDQILTALKMLNENSEDRRAVVQIWNSEFDLGKKSKDLPCNDLFMIKVRNGKLRTSIANRSNDLHWGLPTNVYQFSFVSEFISEILGVELGTQTHNSHSLHFYIDNPIATNLYDEMKLSDGEFEDLYDKYEPLKFNFNFLSEGIEERLKEIDFYVKYIVDSLESGYVWDSKFSQDLFGFSEGLWRMYHLLHIYLEYQRDGRKTDEARVEYINKIVEFCGGIHHDFEALAVNFFSSKLKDKSLLESFIYNF